MQTLEELATRFPRTGRLEWIGVSHRRLATIEPRTEATLQPDTGIDADHHAAGGSEKRQVTLIQQEHLPVIAALLGLSGVTPEQLRRNLLVSGINLLALKSCRFRIGEVLLEGTGPCVPCSRMEENLGPGGYNATLGHGGITARVLEGGTIRVGDAVVACGSAAG